MNAILAHISTPPPAGYNYLFGAVTCIFIAGLCAFGAVGSGKNAPKRDSGDDDPSDTPRKVLVVLAWIMLIITLVLAVIGTVIINS